MGENSFAKLFKQYRLKSGISTLKEFNSLLREYGYKFEESILSKWQNGSRVPKDRKLVIEILKIFTKNGCNLSTEDMDNFLIVTNLPALSKDEKMEISPALVNPISPTNSYFIASDVEMEKEFLKGIKERYIDQKFFYIGDGAKLCYEADKKTKRPHLVTEAMKFSFYPHKLLSSYNTAFISLGCGKVFTERNILEELSRMNSKVTYIGIDSSRAMLDLAISNTYKINIPKYFIFSDFTQNSFRKDVQEIVKNYEKRIFGFLGGTFGNFNQTFLINTLYNLLFSGDYLFFNIVPLKNNVNEKYYYDIYKTYPYKGNKLDFYLNPLKQVGIKDSDGDVELECIESNLSDKYNMQFYFRFKNTVDLNIQSEKIKILKDEKISIMSIRLYDITKLVAFVEAPGFKVISNVEDNSKMRLLLFQKL